MGRKVGGDAFEQSGARGGDFSGRVGLKEGLDAIDLSGQSEGGLDGSDIGDGQVVVGTDQVRRGFEEKTDTEVGLVSGGDGEERVSRLEVKAFGEGAGEGDGVGFGDESDGIGGGAESVFESVGDELAIGKGVDPN